MCFAYPLVTLTRSHTHTHNSHQVVHDLSIFSPSPSRDRGPSREQRLQEREQRILEEQIRQAERESRISAGDSPEELRGDSSKAQERE